jgi:hypothetical protein
MFKPIKKLFKKSPFYKSPKKLIQPPPKPNVPPTKLPSKKLGFPPVKPNVPPTKLPSKKVIFSPLVKVQQKIKSPVKVQQKIKSPVKVQQKIKSPVKVQQKIKSPVKQPHDLYAISLPEVQKLQRYTIMNPRDVWGSKIKNMTNQKYVEEHAPKFAKVLEILRRDILPTTRKTIAAKALIFVKNKKDGVEALATYLTSVGKMTPINGIQNTDTVPKGDNLLIMGEIGEKSPLYKYSATNQNKTKGIISKFNEMDNKIGDKYPVMIIHEKFLEGLDLVGVTHIILVQEPGSVGTFDQIIGRGVRNCSHKYLPPSMWNVKIISLVNVGEKPTPDELIINYRKQNTKLVDTIITDSQNYSLDCKVSQKRYNLNCK